MRLLLVDGHYYAYRSFYAIRSLSNSRGEPTNALYGLAKTLKRMNAELKPDLAAFILDGGLPASRMEVQPDYKANRSETPPDLAAQFPLLGAVAAVLGHTTICVEGEEADDLLASYAREASRRGIEVILATNDKDLMQLVGETGGAVTVYQPVTGGEGFGLLDSAGVTAKWGVPPERIGDLLTLTGDAVDNIPGVPGVGPKTAAALLQEHGTLDALIEVVATAPTRIKSEKLRAALVAARESGHLARNRIMVSLRDALPLPVTIDELLFRPDPAQQAALFAKLEFRTLQREAEALMKETETGGSNLPVSAPPASSAPSSLVQGDFLL